MPRQHQVQHVMKHIHIYDIHERDSIVKAIHFMDDYNISALPVRNNENVYSGVISKSDITSKRFLKALQAKRSPENIMVFEIMNHTAPLYVNETDPLQDAITFMYKRHVHRLFVSDDKQQMTGVISTSDILRLLVVENCV